MKHRSFSPLFFLFFLFPVFGYGNQIQDVNINELKLIDRVGQSALYQSGKVRVLLLQGTPYQMGYAHGKLLAGDITKLVDRIMTVCRAGDNESKGDFFANTLEKVYQHTLPYVPARYREELKGLADGSGLDFHKMELVNLFPEQFHCSGFAFMGKATLDGKLIHGRVLDYMTEVGIQDHSIIIVTKTPGTHTVMLAGYTGFIGCVTGMNNRQISIGEMGMGGEGHWDGTPMTYMLRQVLEECTALSQVKDFFTRTRKTCEYAYVVSDGKVPSAIGVHARYDLVEFLEPGQATPLLPSPLPDSIMVSAGNRYTYLAKRAKELYGKIDLAATVELIKKPLAMNSNFHDAIMIPEDNTMYLANAVSPDQKDFQACYQTYYKHDLNRYEALLADLARKYAPTQPALVALPQPVTTTQPVSVLEGRVPAALHRPIKPAATPQLAEYLKLFETPAENFPYRMKMLHQTEKYNVWQVTFPSPYKSPDAENNTVWCEYFQNRKPGPRPAVIVLHFLQNEFTLPRVVCHTLANTGCDALLVKMAYYGERRPKDPTRQNVLMKNLDNLVNGVRQSVMDVRRAAEFLDAQPNIEKNQIGICGISLGALVGSLTIGVDGNFPKAAIILGGGNMVKMIQAHSREVREINEYMQKNKIDIPRLTKIFEPIEPLTYIDRAGNTQCLLINARADTIIPPECTRSLAARLPKAKVVWYNADHNSLIWHLVEALAKVQSFFIEKS